jgi:glycosyltransferase involved in cell wall biosynthesis
MVAEFNPGKRHRDAIDALATARTPSLHLVFAGWGPLFKKIQAYAAQKKVSDRCHFPGHLDDVRPLLKGAAASVLPSEREGLPRSILESMAMGTPVIGTNIRGTQDLLEGECGKLYPVGDVEALARIFDYLATGNTEFAKNAASAAERVKKYDLDSVLKLHKVLYSRMIE